MVSFNILLNDDFVPAYIISRIINQIGYDCLDFQILIMYLTSNFLRVNLKTRIKNFLPKNNVGIKSDSKLISSRPQTSKSNQD